MPGMMGVQVKNANSTIVHGDAVWKTHPQEIPKKQPQLAPEPDIYKPPVRMRV